MAKLLFQANVINSFLPIATTRMFDQRSGPFANGKQNSLKLIFAMLAALVTYAVGIMVMLRVLAVAKVDGTGTGVKCGLGEACVPQIQSSSLP